MIRPDLSLGTQAPELPGVFGAARQLAAEQEGAISRAQVLALGGTDEWLAARVASGAWQRAYDGVYVTFGGPLPFRTRAQAALLRAGPGSMAAGRTAAVLDGLAEQPGPKLEVLIPAGRRVRGEPSLDVRRSRAATERRHPARTPARTRVEDTVLDLCDASAALRDVAMWVSRACARRLTTPARLRVALAARRRHRWRFQLVAMLADVELGAQSPLELRYLTRVERAHGLPAGVRQRRVAGRSVRWIDVDHDEFATRIELDGRLGHVEDGAFRDRARDNAST